MEVGIIAPIEKLGEYCITRVQYILPKLFQEEERYREFYLERVRQGDKVIVDCAKPGWRREPENLDTVGDVLEQLGRMGSRDSIRVVTPSKMFNWKGTLEVAEGYMEVLGNWDYAGCLEGTNWEEVSWCATKLKDKVGMYAVPAHMIRLVGGNKLDKRVVWVDNYKKVDEISDTEGIIVTSLPVRLGLGGQLLSDYLPSPPELDFYHNDFKWDKMVRRNIKEVISFYG